MERRSQGGSGLEISPIGLGTWAIGGCMWGWSGRRGRVSRRFMPASTMASTGSTRHRSTGPAIPRSSSASALKELPASRRPMVFTKFGLGIDSQAHTRRRRHARRGRRVRRQPAAPRRRSDRSLPAALARHAADRRDRGRLRCASRRRARFARSACRTSRWRNSRNGGRPVCRSIRSAPYSILRPAVAARAAALVRQERRRRHRATRRSSEACCSAPGEDKTFPGRRRREASTRTMPAHAFSGTCRPLTKSRRSRPRRPQHARNSVSACCFHTPGLTGCIVGAGMRGRADSWPTSA